MKRGVYIVHKHPKNALCFLTITKKTAKKSEKVLTGHAGVAHEVQYFKKDNVDFEFSEYKIKPFIIYFFSIYV